MALSSQQHLNVLRRRVERGREVGRGHDGRLILLNWRGCRGEISIVGNCHGVERLEFDALRARKDLQVRNSRLITSVCGLCAASGFLGQASRAYVGPGAAIAALPKGNVKGEISDREEQADKTVSTVQDATTRQCCFLRPSSKR